MNLTLLQVVDPAAIAPHTEQMDFIELAIKGGWIMIPLLLLSLIAVFIFTERLITIRKAAKVDVNFMNHIRECILDNRIDSAMSLCRSNNTPIARMVERGLNHRGKPMSDTRIIIEGVGNLEVSKLEKSLPMLATIAGGAPMLGFLGTVTGMIKAFFNMANAGNNLDINLLSSGIYEAMVTTVAGLVVGIVAYFAYNYLTARVQQVAMTLENALNEFVEILYSK